MTDRIRHLTITLDADYRDDDVESIVEAIRMIRGVEYIEEGIVTAEDHLARAAVRAEIQRSLHEAVDRVFKLKDFDRSLAERKDK